MLSWRKSQLTTTKIEVKKLNKSYRGNFYEKKNQVLKDISFAIEKGTCTGLIGHNGAGKTTTLKVILGLIRPGSGSVLLNGKDITRDDRKNIGYMPESDRLPMRLNCIEVLYLQLHLMGIIVKNKKEFCLQRLDKVGLKNHNKKLVSKLSKGMRRRLAWAVANISDPDLLILDEPFSGLDPVGRRDIVGWIEDAKLQSKTIILCTHELWSISKLCERLVILKQGSVVYRSEDSQDQSKTYSFLVPLHDLSKVETLSQILDSFSLIEKTRSHDAFTCRIDSYDKFLQLAEKLKKESIEVQAFHKNSILSEQEAIKYF